MKDFIGSEFKVIAVVIVGLLIGELVISRMESRLSIDLHHLKSLEALATNAVGSQADQTELTFLFLGNSMTRYGINADVFREIAGTNAHVPLNITKINPDATKIADWYYLYSNYFHEKGRRPDVLVIGFQGDQLADQPTQHLNRLARFYDCDLNDWPDLQRWDLRGVEQSCSFLVSRISSLHGNRDRFDRRVLDLVVPHYRESVKRINQSQLATRSNSSNAEPTHVTYSRLRRFLDMVHSDGTRLIFVAMPVAQKYDIDESARALIAQYGFPLVDCRHVPNLNGDMIPDGIHLNEEGAVRYTSHLAQSFPWRELVLATELTKGIPAKGGQTVRLVSGESAEGEVVR